MKEKRKNKKKKKTNKKTKIENSMGDGVTEVLIKG